jgi:hypothetical protein
MTKAMRPFRDSRVRSWLSGLRTDVPAEPLLIGPDDMNHLNIYIFFMLIIIAFVSFLLSPFIHLTSFLFLILVIRCKNQLTIRRTIVGHRYGTSVTNGHGYVPLVVNTFGLFLIHDLSSILQSNTMGDTSGAGATYPSGAPESPRFLVGSCYSIFNFMCDVDRCLSCFCHCVICPSSIYRF